jgi:nucleoside 2-deoxyribosyltransferase
MKCFVASAFGREDVDSIYDNCIFPTLKRLSIAPFRVDRVEHNDDIDDKIMQLLDGADLAIADLTYARPSVYFEAGYFSGKGKPIVYIARTDHFRAKDNDPEGLLRVHFDLQMKNIIPWSRANDAFSKRLEKRIRLILKPLIMQKKIDDKFKSERVAFERQPEAAKVNMLQTKAGNLLKSRSFSLPESDLRRGPLSNELLAIRENNQKSQQIAVICTSSFTKKDLESIAFTGAVRGIESNRELPVHFHYVVVSLRPVPRSRITQALSSYRQLEDGTMHCRYYRNRPYEDVFVSVISGIKSVIEFAANFRIILERYELN